MKTREQLLSDGYVGLTVISGLLNNSGESTYYINRNGDVYSMRSMRLLRRQQHSLGYEQIYITYFNGGGRWHKLHRLVALQFIPNELNLTDVNHINGIKNDNRVENLEWLSHSDNIKHSYRSLGRVHSAAYSYKRVRCSNGKVYESLKAASLDTGCRISNISACLKGRIKHSKKFMFSYA